MVLLVSALSLYFYQVSVDCHPDNIFPLFFRRGDHGMGAQRLRPDSEARGVVEGLQLLYEGEASGGERAEAEG